MTIRIRRSRTDMTVAASRAKQYLDESASRPSLWLLVLLLVKQAHYHTGRTQVF